MSRPPLPEVSQTIDRERIADYARRSGDFNPLHVDEEYARNGPFGTIVAHGPIALQVFLDSAAAWLGGPLPPGCSIDVAYRGPVRAGDTVTCRTGTTLEHASTVVVGATCVNQREEEVLQALLSVPRHLAPKDR